MARKLERIARSQPMIDNEAREQEPSGIAAPVMDVPGLPCKGNRACDMIEQAGGASRLGLVLAARGNLTGKTCGAIGQFAQAIAPALRNSGTVIEPRMQVCGERRIGAMASDRPRKRIDRDDVAGALPDRAEMRIAQQPRRGELLDVTDAAAHLERIAADLAGVAGSAKFQRRRQDS